MRDKKVALVKLEADGRTLIAGTGREDYKVFDIEGLTGLDFDFGMKSGPQTPNSVIYRQKPTPRQITIGIHTAAENRDFLSAFFNPFVRGKLTVTWDKVTRFIHYYPMPVTIEQQTVYKRVSAEAVLLCPEPYWLDPDDYGRNIADKQPLIAFPSVFMGYGVVSDYKVYNQEVVIQNKGDVPVPITVVFTALGDVKNPKLIINGGEYVRAFADMKKGDNITFSTNPDDLFAKMNGEDILNMTDPRMSFFQLPKGQNIIKYEADAGTSNLNVFIYFRARYVGL